MAYPITRRLPSGTEASAARWRVKHSRIAGLLASARKTAAVRWNVASDVVVAWIVTLPAAALFGAAFYELYKFLS